VFMCIKIDLGRHWRRVGETKIIISSTYLELVTCHRMLIRSDVSAACSRPGGIPNKKSHGPARVPGEASPRPRRSREGSRTRALD